MNQAELSEKYRSQSIHYLENALSSIEAGDAEKAGEFVWGSMAEALKALALSRGIPLKNHREIWNYVESLAKEREDKSIYDAFVHANLLHVNFYESELELKDVRRIAEDVKKTVAKLLSLIPEEEQGH